MDIGKNESHQAEWTAKFLLTPAQVAELLNAKATRNLQYMKQMQIKPTKSWENCITV